MVTAIGLATPALAQQTQTSPPAQTTSPRQDAQAADANKQAADLPVSLDRIREALQQPAAEPLKIRALDEKPQFRVEVNERQKIDELLKSLKFNSPPVPGGLYGYEQQRLLFPSVDNPLAQPYAAFSQGELVQISITTLLEKYLMGKLVGAITGAERERAERAAREEVQQAIADFWAAQGKTPPSVPKP